MSNAITATGEKPLTPAMLRELSVRSDRQGLIRAASHYGVIVVVGMLIWLVSSRYGLAWALPLIVAQSYFVAFLFMVVHETAHKTAFQSRALNLVFGHLNEFCAFVEWKILCTPFLQILKVLFPVVLASHNCRNNFTERFSVLEAERIRFTK